TALAPRAEVGARLAGSGEGTALGGGGEGTSPEESTSGQGAPTQYSQGPSGRGGRCPSWAEVLSSGFRGPGGTLCPASSHLGPWQQQVKTRVEGRLGREGDFSAAWGGRVGGCAAGELPTQRKGSLLPALLSGPAPPLITVGELQDISSRPFARWQAAVSE
ncbi:hypothetical protein E2I00_000715, partial [Balaenoptera physalus]